MLSPIALGALPQAAWAAVAGWNGTEAARVATRNTLQRRFGAAAVTLTDSGTSALVLAIRMVVPPGGPVALPAYGCPDLVAASVLAGARARFYDVDPETLSPDLDSVRAALRRGAQAAVVAHWYGYPADVGAVAALARESGAVVIEDAAQHAGGRLNGLGLGRVGSLTVLSFGRGKGTTAGRGGALLAKDPAWSQAIDAWEEKHGPRAKRGWGIVVGATAQWMLGRPWLYGIPSAIPALHLGETVYRAAGEPEALTSASVPILKTALAESEAVVAGRIRVAESLAPLLNGARDLTPIRPLHGGEPGFLRLAVRDLAGRRPDVYAGVVRGYPRPLTEEASVRGISSPDDPEMPGAAELCRGLFTLPTHSYVTDGDRARIERWARGRGVGDAGTPGA